MSGDDASAVVVALDHVQVCCPPGGEDAARAFWNGLLGLPEVVKPAGMDDPRGCWFRMGAVGLHVGILDPFTPARKAHPALRISDVAALEGLVRRLEAAGHPVTWSKVPIAEARCKVDDPFGNLVELLVGTTG
ncbi:MAG: glyoxalase [Thermoleophilia bacterium]|nr:glyoxalase [Thermoleophilia bacterium]